ncbi:MAG: phytanoyl-CoA dioxygenase family protein [Deltaproteobacteria bacterium]|nr:phytanoyl-CoA dioxygenase family protein [Deltaproteobacteria bacterium]
MSMEDWLAKSKHGEDFVRQGYCVVPIQGEQRASLDRARALLVAGLRAALPGGDGLGDEDYLNRFHKFSNAATLNDVRVRIHRELGGSPEYRKLVFNCVKNYLFDLVGNEVVMQRNVNPVTHLPRDKTQLLYLHTDAWSGCSPYEVILWMPLVDVYDTKSMYLCKRDPNNKHMRDLKAGAQVDSAVELLKKIRPDIAPVKMKYGEALLFSPTLMHGAEENLTDETRFILNVRFKSLFSPYGTKALGETFLPVNYLPATEIGLSYESEFGIVDGG